MSEKPQRTSLERNLLQLQLLARPQQKIINLCHSVIRTQSSTAGKGRVAQKEVKGTRVKSSAVRLIIVKPSEGAWRASWHAD